MELWGWVIVYVLGFALLQLLVYRYLQNGEDAQLFQTTPPHGESARSEDGGEPTDGSTQRCPHCGAHNDAGAPFTYCHQCTKPLGR